MGYNKQNFESGQILSAENLNVMENGIVKNERYHGLKGKRISFIGDSISAFTAHVPYGYTPAYPSTITGTNVNNVNQMWWKRVVDEAGMIWVSTCASSGTGMTSLRGGAPNSTTDATCGSSDKRVSDLSVFNSEAPDIVVIYMGVNDFSSQAAIGNWKGGPLPANGTTVETISEAYALLVSKILQKYPDVEVFCSTIMPVNGFKTTDSYGPGEFPTAFGDSNNYTTIHDYNNAIREVANALGVNVLDMHGCGITFFNTNKYLVDGIHPNAEGHKLMAKRALSELEAKSKFMHELNDEQQSDDVSAWYTHVAMHSANDRDAIASIMPFAYTNAEVVAACQNVPINVLRISVLTAGGFSFGKVGNGKFTQLGTIQLVNPSYDYQIYEIPQVVLAEGEKLWFGQPADAGNFHFGRGNLDHHESAAFNSGYTASNLTGGNVSNGFNLGIDIGYFTAADIAKYNVVRY